MKLDIARQGFVPAFLTLFALTLVAVCCVMTGTQNPEPIDRTIPLLGGLIDRFQAAYPLWARLLSGCMILFTGLCAGRIGVRYNLYAVKTCLSIPLYAVVACGIFPIQHHLVAFSAAMLLALSLKNYCRAYCNGYGFDAIFRASLYLGIVPLIYAPATPLVLILLVALLLFRRTRREAVVAVAALLLPVAIACYVGWALGGSLLQPLVALYTSLTQGAVLQLFTFMPLHALVMLATILLLATASGIYFLVNFYAAGSKSRFIFFFICSAAAWTTAMLFSPSATPALFALLAVPTALLLPVIFVRIHRNLAWAIYLMLLIAATLIPIL